MNNNKIILLVFFLLLSTAIYTEDVARVMQTASIALQPLLPFVTRRLQEPYRSNINLLPVTLQDSAYIAANFENLIPYLKSENQEGFVNNIQKLQLYFNCFKKNDNLLCNNICSNKTQCIAQSLRIISATLHPLTDNILGKVVHVTEKNNTFDRIEPGLLINLATLHAHVLPEMQSELRKKITEDLISYTRNINNIYTLLDLIVLLIDPAGSHATPEQQNSIAADPIIINAEEFVLE